MERSEAARLRVLADYGVLDTPPEEAFERLTKLAADLFDAPIALVSLVDEERQWFKSKRGLDIESTSRSHAFCARAIQGEPGSVFVVEDVATDPRFVGNPLVAAATGFRFYMGAVLTDPDGYNLGTLCVIDIKPRPAPSASDRERLASLAAIVMDELELRRVSRAAVDRQRKLELADAEMARARQVAEEQARRAAVAEEVAGLGYWRFDLKTNEFTGTAQYRRIYGVDPNGDMDFHALRAMAHPDAPSARERIEGVIKTGRSAERVITRIIRSGGETRHLASDIAAERDDTGEVVAIIGTIMDVTDQENAKTALATSEERFRRLAMNASDIICETSPSGVLTFVSPAALAITGYAPEEIIGRRYDDLMRSDEADQLRDVSLAAWASQRASAHPIEFRSTHKSGREIWLECQPTLATDPATGQCIGITDVIRDVTARKQLETELRLARAKAEMAAKVKREFLANMSHELRTPLTGIIGFTHLAAQQPDLSPRTRVYVDRVSEASRALLCTVNDILDFSKLEAGIVSFQPQPTQLEALCGGALELLAPLAVPKGLDLNLQYDAEVASLVVAVDPDRVRQILLNLVGNGLKFTEEGSVSVDVSYDKASQRLTIEVVDTGLGIPGNKIGVLFKRFSQVDGSRSRAHGGTGLGLAICKGLVEAMGGEIGVDSKQGQGSRFWFTIPAPEANMPVLDDAPEADQPIFAGLRVLVVDDHQTNRELARLFMTNVGAEVYEAADGEIAVEMADQQSFDLILMDLRMPKLDGVGALKRIRQSRGPNVDTAIVAFTADVDEGAADRLVEIGFQGMVAKPMDPHTLIGAIMRALGAAPDTSQSSVAA